VTQKDNSASPKASFKPVYQEIEGCNIKIVNLMSRPEYKFVSERKTSGMVYWVKER